MSTLSLTFDLDESGAVLSPFVKSLSGKAVELHHDTKAAPHPFVAHGVAYRALENSLRSFLRVLDAADLDPKPQQDLASEFGYVIYRSAELFDVYASAIPQALGAGGYRSVRNEAKDYRATIKRLRAHWASICNAMKHASNILAPVSAKFDGGLIVHGFSVLCHVENGMALNPNIHKAQRSFGYDVTLGRLVHELLRADLAASRLVHALPERGVPRVRQSKARIGLADVVRGISVRPMKALPDNQPLEPGFDLTATHLVLRKVNIAPPHEKARMSVVYTPQEGTLQFPLV